MDEPEMKVRDVTTPTYWGEILLVLERINTTLEYIYKEVAAIPKVKGNRL